MGENSWLTRKASPPTGTIKNSIRNVSWLLSYVALNLKYIKYTVRKEDTTKNSFMDVLYTEMKDVNRSRYRVTKTRANII